MESLYARASSVDVIECKLPSGRLALLRRLHVHFGRATPDRLRPGSLAPSYTAKPLVSFKGAAMFGELALLKWLEVDGWEGAWLDTSHGRKAWRDMPTTSESITLPLEPGRVYDRIVAENGGRASGSFDVMSWRNGQVVFLSYRDADHPFSRAELGWMAAALRAGVAEAEMFVVVPL